MTLSSSASSVAWLVLSSALPPHLEEDRIGSTRESSTSSGHHTSSSHSSPRLFGKQAGGERPGSTMSSSFPSFCLVFFVLFVSAAVRVFVGRCSCAPCKRGKIGGVFKQVPRQERGKQGKEKFHWRRFSLHQTISGKEGREFFQLAAQPRQAR